MYTINRQTFKDIYQLFIYYTDKNYDMLNCKVYKDGKLLGMLSEQLIKKEIQNSESIPIELGFRLVKDRYYDVLSVATKILTR